MTPTSKTEQMLRWLSFTTRRASSRKRARDSRSCEMSRGKSLTTQSLSKPPEMSERAPPTATLSPMLPHVRVVDGARTAALLEKAKRFGLSCDVGETACAASFAQLAGIDEVVIVRTTAVGGDVLAVLSRVDGRSGAV